MWRSIVSFFKGDDQDLDNSYVFSTFEDGIVRPEDKKAEDVDLDLWRHRLTKWDSFKGQFPHHALDVLMHGIPDCMRGEAWKVITGSNTLMSKSPGVYHGLLERDSVYDDLIRKDVHRTFPSHKDFKLKDSGGQASLYNVLKAYSVMDEEVGYCQGMSFVCATILCYLNEEEAFWVFVSLLKISNMRMLYTVGLPLLQTCFFKFNQLMKTYFPELSQHFEEQGILPIFYATDWFSTLFSYSMNVDFSSRVLDVVFLEGINFLFKVGLCIMLEHEEELFYFDFEEAILFLKESLKTEDPDIILKCSTFENFDVVMDCVEKKLENGQLNLDFELYK
eukprot:TRINITY_DN13599_c0_g1_i1.p1 TRINITY_DN13599_c0_g1~~TRINITY_DN13599_c0_g1_i1.p1  ORF type:complete len:334 (-),score=58.24 TRINITY_DN13599_c0_g1_i1:8-1009(-)